MEERILATAYEHLLRLGPAGVSLRAIARDLGLVSSAVYTYVPSRTALLTTLIIRSYDSLGRTVEEAERDWPRDDVQGRFTAAVSALRRWSLTHPQEHALLFGTPLPDFQAPPETTAAGTRVPVLLTQILRDTPSARRVTDVPTLLSEAVEPLRVGIGAGVTDDRLVAGLTLWEATLGLVSYEVFGHLDGPVAPAPPLREALFAEQVSRLWETIASHPRG